MGGGQLEGMEEAGLAEADDQEETGPHGLEETDLRGQQKEHGI